MKKEFKKAIAEKIDFSSISISKKEYPDSEILGLDETIVNDFR